jgi:2-desacetyl-2-hydroxyethyl bacteriochlorophyllide A dehydrogenase
MRVVEFQVDGERAGERPDPEITPDGVRIEVAYCGICGSDLHAGEPDFHPGTVMGHEFSGVIVELGAEVTGFAVGDHVVVNPNGGWCGACAACERGWHNMCARVWETAVGLAHDGGLASHTVVPARSVRRIPADLPLDQAALIEPIAVALRSVRGSGIALGDDAIVFGGGPIGLLITTLLRAAGAGRITVVEPTPARRALALRQGATDVIDPAASSVEEAFPEAMRAPAFAFECSGVAELVGTAARVLRPRGVLTVTGFSRRPPSFDAADLIFKELTIRGSFIYLDEFEAAIDLLASGRIDVAALISGVVSVDDAASAFTAMRTSPDAVKYLISARHTASIA